MKSLIKKLLLSVGILLLVLPESLSALAAFSRQTGKSCMACHAQNMPKLNSYGRKFALSGYTFYEQNNTTESLIEGSDVPLGLTSAINVSLVLKARYIKTNQKKATATDEIVGQGDGELQVREVSGLYLGGRIADNFGGLFSIKSDPSNESNVIYSGKLIMAYQTFDGYSGLSLTSTKTNGIFSGMENYNTGLNTPLKQFENSYATNAAQATGIANGPATSLQAYYGGSNLFLTAGMTIPEQNNEGIDAGRSLLPFWRVAYNQPIGTWNFMIGTYGFNGEVRASDQSLNGGPIDLRATLVNIHKEGLGYDFEMSGSFFDISTMTTLNHVAKNIVNVNPSSHLTSYNLQRTDNEGTSVEFQINPIEPLGLKVAYLNYANNDNAAVNQEFIKNYDYDAYTFGVSYIPRENILLGIDYSHYSLEPDTDSYSNVYVTAVLVF